MRESTKARVGYAFGSMGAFRRNALLVTAPRIVLDAARDLKRLVVPLEIPLARRLFRKGRPRVPRFGASGEVVGVQPRRRNDADEPFSTVRARAVVRLADALKRLQHVSAGVALVLVEWHRLT